MIYIVTPCSRPKNLRIIKSSIPKQVSWIIMLDNKINPQNISESKFSEENVKIHYSKLGGNFGNPLRNEFLELYRNSFTSEDWVYYLDDDNIIHPKLSTFFESMEIPEDIHMLTWGQLHPNNQIRLSPTDNPKSGNIDTACFMFKPYYIGDTLWRYQYDADGYFAHELSKILKIQSIPDYMCYYNFLT